MEKLSNSIYKVVQQKTNIKGYWKNPQGKLYIDNIKLEYPKNSMEFEAMILNCFNNGEESIFVRGKNFAYIIDKDFSIVEYHSHYTVDIASISLNMIDFLL